MHTPHKTIALLSDNLIGEYQTLIRNAVETLVRKEDYNFQYIVGRDLDSPFVNIRAQNDIFNRVNPTRVSGVIIMAGSMSNYCSHDRILELCRQFRNLPLCVTGVEVENIPSILIDNSFFSESVEHLVQVHGCQRLAFLGGTKQNAEAQIRRRAFLKAVHKSGLEFDADLEVEANFVFQNGLEATLELIGRNKHFDALVVANDEMALGALRALETSGIRVPQDVRVVGFDDMPEARFATPTLTTMRQPFEELGRLSVELLLRQISGETVPLRSTVQPYTIVRESCGCQLGSDTYTTISNRPKDAPEKDQAQSSQEDNLKELLRRHIQSSANAHTNWTDRLVDALYNEIDGDANAFTMALQHIMNDAGYGARLSDEMQDAISILRTHFYQNKVVTNIDIEGVWHRARLFLFNTLALRNMHDRMSAIRAGTIVIYRSIEARPEMLTRKKLVDAIIVELQTMGILNAVVSVFADEQKTKMECVVAIRNGEILEDKFLEDNFKDYPLDWLIPDFMHTEEPKSFIVYSLSSDADRLGILALESGVADNYYEILGEYVSSILKLIAVYQDQRQQLKAEADQRRRAAEMQHRQKLESLGVLAGGIAHDFNNLLSAMAGNLDVIRMEIERNKPSLEPVDECRSVVKHATGLVGQLLAYSGKGKFVVSSVNLNSVIRNLENFLHMAISKKVALKFSLAENLPDVEADVTQLNQIFINLIVNASEAVEEGSNSGTVVVETSTMNLDQSYFDDTINRDVLEAGQYIISRVSDNGVGIEKEHMSHIFDPFFTTKFTGRGLGLAAVLGIIRGHRGAVKVDSKPGSGTVFEIAFPSLPTRSVEPIKKPVPPLSVGQKTILIVDDEPAVLKAGSRLLKSMGFSTIEAANGEQAVEIISNPPHGISCVLLDITMPGMGGIATMIEIDRIASDIPVILTSGYSEEQAIVHTRSVVPTAFIQKPYDRESLGALLRDVLVDTKVKQE